MKLKNKYIGLALFVALASAPTVIAVEAQEKKLSTGERIARWCFQHPKVTTAAAAAAAYYALYYAEPRLEAAGYPALAAMYDVVGKGAAALATGITGVAAMLKISQIKDFFVNYSDEFDEKTVVTLKPRDGSGWNYQGGRNNTIFGTKLPIGAGQFLQLDWYDSNNNLLETFFFNTDTNSEVLWSAIQEVIADDKINCRLGLRR